MRVTLTYKPTVDTRHFLPGEFVHEILRIGEHVRKGGDPFARRDSLRSVEEFRFRLIAELFLGGLDGRAPVDDADGAWDANFRAAGDVSDDGSDNWSDDRTDGSDRADRSEDGALTMGRGVIELEVVLKYDSIDLYIVQY